MPVHACSCMLINCRNIASLVSWVIYVYCFKLIACLSLQFCMHIYIYIYVHTYVRAYVLNALCLHVSPLGDLSVNSLWSYNIIYIMHYMLQLVLVYIFRFNFTSRPCLLASPCMRAYRGAPPSLRGQTRHPL